MSHGQAQSIMNHGHTVVKFKGIDVQCQTTYTEKNQNGILICIQLS